MKNFRLLTLLGTFLIAGTLAGCLNNKENNIENNKENDNGDFIIEDITGENNDVINYNDELVELASECILGEDSIWSAYDESASIEDVELAINNTINGCNDAKNKINELGNWEGDSSLKDGVLELIDKEIAYYSKFSELLPYSEKEELTEDEKLTYDTVFAEVQSLDDELNKANTNLSTIQSQFAKNHGFELEATEENESEEA